VRISFFVALIDLVLAYPLAYYLSVAPPRTRAIGLFIVLLPFWSSQLIRAFAWLVLFGRHGIVNDTLIGAGLIEQPLRLLYTETAVLVGSAYVMLPFMVFPIYSTMRRIDLNLVTAAQGLGASGLQAFLKVYWPLSLNGVMAGSILVFVVTLGSYTNAAVLGGGKVTMVALSIKQNVSVLLDFQMAAALSLVLLAVTLLLFWIFAGFLKSLSSGTAAPE
jgi:ABC-type spermidine/putrescine transport system permease subunit I